VSAITLKVGASVAVSVIAQDRVSLITVKQMSGRPVSFYVTDPAQFDGKLQVPLGGQYTFFRAGGYATGDAIGTVRMASGGVVDVSVDQELASGLAEFVGVVPGLAPAGEVVVGVDENGALIFAAGGGGGFPRLDQVLDPTAAKIFDMHSFPVGLNFEATYSPTPLSAFLDINVDMTSNAVPSGGSLALNVLVFTNSNRPYPVFAFDGGAQIGMLEDLTGGSDQAGVYGALIYAKPGGDVVLGSIHGLEVQAQCDGSVTVTKMSALHIFEGGPQLGCTATDYNGIEVESPNHAFGGTLTNAIGLHILDYSGSGSFASNNWAIKVEKGLVELGDALKVVGNIGFFNHAPAAKPTVTGAKLPSDVALASLLTALSGLGLLTDSTS